jgi:hypothetical protein
VKGFSEIAIFGFMTSVNLNQKNEFKEVCMANLSNRSDQSISAEKTKTKDATWPDFAAGLYDKLSGRGSQITYEFDDLSLFIPAKLGNDSDHFHWKMNGIMRISTQDQVNQEKSNA